MLASVEHAKCDWVFPSSSHSCGATNAIWLDLTLHRKYSSKRAQRRNPSGKQSGGITADRDRLLLAKGQMERGCAPANAKVPALLDLVLLRSLSPALAASCIASIQASRRSERLRARLRSRAEMQARQVVPRQPSWRMSAAMSNGPTQAPRPATPIWLAINESARLSDQRPPALISCDEAGFTGSKLLDDNQPIFAYAAIDLSAVEADAIVKVIKARYRIRAPELKSKLLRKRDNWPAIAFDIVQHVTGHAIVIAADEDGESVLLIGRPFEALQK
jgi:hypothetical protein